VRSPAYALHFAPDAVVEQTMPMPRTRSFRRLQWLALAASCGLSACSSSESSSSPSAANVVLEGEATAAQLTVFQNEQAREWAWAGGQFDTPHDNAQLDASPPLTFAWHADPADFAQGGAPGEIVMTHRLLYSTASNEHLLEVFTTLPEYTPDATHWRKLVDAREPISVSLTTGTFVGSDLPEDGGPFIGQALTFTIR